MAPGRFQSLACPGFLIVLDAWKLILNSLNMSYDYVIDPLFVLLGQGLSSLILQPLVFLQFPVSLQVVTAAFIFASLSIFLRHFFKIKEHEQEFRRLFAEKYSIQEDIAKLSDWKIKSLMYKHVDTELDDFFNTYMAEKYVRYVAVYLLPLFTGEIWLNSVFSPDNLYNIHGSEYVLMFPVNSMGVTGMTVSTLFLLAWLLGLVIIVCTVNLLTKMIKRDDIKPGG